MSENYYSDFNEKEYLKDKVFQEIKDRSLEGIVYGALATAIVDAYFKCKDEPARQEFYKNYLLPMFNELEKHKPLTSAPVYDVSESQKFITKEVEELRKHGK